MAVFFYDWVVVKAVVMILAVWQVLGSDVYFFVCKSKSIYLTQKQQGLKLL